MRLPEDAYKEIADILMSAIISKWDEDLEIVAQVVSEEIQDTLVDYGLVIAQEDELTRRVKKILEERRGSYDMV